MLTIDVGVLLALGKIYYRRESQSGVGLGQGRAPAEQLWAVRSSMEWSASSRGGRYNGECPPPTFPIHSAGTSEGGHLHLLERNGISEICICNVFNKGHLFGLYSKILGVLPFPHLQPLTLFSLLQPPSLFSHHASVRARHSLERPWKAGSWVYTQSNAGSSKGSGSTWKLLGLSVVWGCRPLTVPYRPHKHVTLLGYSLADCPNMIPQVKSF